MDDTCLGQKNNGLLESNKNEEMLISEVFNRNQMLNKILQNFPRKIVIFLRVDVKNLNERESWNT